MIVETYCYQILLGFSPGDELTDALCRKLSHTPQCIIFTALSPTLLCHMCELDCSRLKSLLASVDTL
jgi:hypothetical protein